MFALDDRVTDDFYDYSQKQQYVSTLSIVLAHNNGQQSILWERGTKEAQIACWCLLAISRSQPHSSYTP